MKKSISYLCFLPKLHLLLAVLLLPLLSFRAIAQSSSDKNDVNAPDHSSTIQKIEEVYGPINGTFFQINPDLVPYFIDLLEKRIRYVSEPLAPKEKYPSLKDIPLNNKYNPGMVRDVAYVEGVFNPLKYRLEFFTQRTQVYRIDDQTLLVIEPKQ
jgi:hypothetical protein